MGTKARRCTSLGGGSGCERGRADPEHSCEVVERRFDIGDLVDADSVDAHSGGTQLLRILESVLLGTHDHELRLEREDAWDVGVLGAPDGREMRLLAEASHCDRCDPPGEKGLGRRGDQADDAFHPTVSSEVAGAGAEAFEQGDERLELVVLEQHAETDLTDCSTATLGEPPSLRRDTDEDTAPIGRIGLSLDELILFQPVDELGDPVGCTIRRSAIFVMGSAPRREKLSNMSTS